jgi:hypothetical protein
MSYQQEVFAFVTRLTGSKNKIVVERAFCEYMGSLEGGVFLSQLLYWCDKGSTEWFYKSYKEWHAETFLSEYQVRQATKRCIELGFLEVELRRANGAPTNHYKVDGKGLMYSILKFLRIETEKFQNQIPKNSRMDSEKFKDVLTETTTENTTENTAVDVAPAAHTPQQEMFAAICEAIGWDYHTLSKEDQGQVAQAVGILRKANYTVDDIRRFMVEVWFKDWRWEKNEQHPTLKQLRQEIGKIRSVIAAAAPAKKLTGVDGYKEMLRERGIQVP